MSCFSGFYFFFFELFEYFSWPHWVNFLLSGVPPAPAGRWESLLSAMSWAAAGLDTGSGTSCAVSVVLVVWFSTVLTNRLGFEHAVLHCATLEPPPLLLPSSCIGNVWRVKNEGLVEVVWLFQTVVYLQPVSRSISSVENACCLHSQRRTNSRGNKFLDTLGIFTQSQLLSLSICQKIFFYCVSKSLTASETYKQTQFWLFIGNNTK